MSLFIKKIVFVSILLVLFTLCSCNANKQVAIDSTKSSEFINDTDYQSEENEITTVAEEYDYTDDTFIRIDELLGLGSGRIEEVINDSLGLKQLLFISDIDNRVVAECGRFIYAPDEGSAYYFKNIYGDDTAELICNTQYGDGAERVKIFRNSNGIIEIGGVNETYICDEFGIVQLESPGSVKEVYDPERNLIVVTLYESEATLEIPTNIEEAFEYLEYEYLE